MRCSEETPTTKLHVPMKFQTPSSSQKYLKFFCEAADMLGAFKCLPCSFSPHPGPLPWGEGESNPVAWPILTFRLAKSRLRRLPLPKGEGRGEGKGVIRVPEVRNLRDFSLTICKEDS